MRLLSMSGLSFFNRIRPDPGFVSPVRSDPIRSGPIRVLSTASKDWAW